jgi:hypothetical protein
MIALGIYFLHIGLERSNLIAGALGPFLAIIGIALSVVSIIQGRSSSTNRSPQPHQSQRSGNNSVNIQSARDIRIGNDNDFGGTR